MYKTANDELFSNSLFFLSNIFEATYLAIDFLSSNALTFLLVNFFCRNFEAPLGSDFKSPSSNSNGDKWNAFLTYLKQNIL